MKSKNNFIIQKHIEPTINEKNINNVGHYQRIPKKIFQTWKTTELSKQMYDSIMTIVANNPEYEYFFYDNEDCRSFLKEFYHPDVLVAYDNLLPGAYKTDLWRYCILYKYGGVYLDCKTISNVPFKTFLRPEVTCLLCRDRPDNYLLNGIMMSVPGNNYILNLIEETVRNSLSGKYKKEWSVRTPYGEHGIYSISGPRMCGIELKKYLQINDIEGKIYCIGDETYDLIMKFDMKTLTGNWNDYDVYYNKEIVLFKNYPGYYHNTIRDGYMSMYYQRKVFIKSDIVPGFTDKSELLVEEGNSGLIEKI